MVRAPDAAQRAALAAWCAADPGPILIGESMGPGSAEQREEALHRVRDTKHLFPINRLRIEHLVRIHERQKRPAIAWAHRAVEAGPSAGVARSACLLDLDPDRVLIAIHPHLDHALDMAGSFAFAPQRVAGAAEIPRLPAGDGPA